MSDTRSTASAQASESGAVPHGGRRARTQPTGWVGWVLFAGIMMIVTGVFHVIEGITALINDQYFAVGSNGLVVQLDFTAWGWAHVVVGAILVLAGPAVMAGRTWGRVVGIVLAVLSAIVNIGFLAAFPFWSTIMIALDIIVVYALAVHGGELKAAD